MTCRTSPIWKVSDKRFIEIVESCETYTEILAHFELKNRGNNHRTLKKRLLELNIKFKSIGYNRVAREKRRKPLSFYLTKGGKGKRNKNGNRFLKRRLIEEGFFEDKCSICGLENKWNGRYLSLHLDHKNGDPEDNRIQNLRLICPNCHSQTDNYCGKAKRKPSKFCAKCGVIIHRNSKVCRHCNDVRKSDFIKNTNIKKPNKEELEKLLILMPVTRVGEKFGVSGNAVIRWMKKYDLKKVYGRGDWAKLTLVKEAPPKKELEERSKYMPSSELEKYYRVSEYLIRKWCKNYNIERPGPSFWAKKRWYKLNKGS